MARKLRYSERKRLAETGSLGDLSHDTVPLALRNAVSHAIDNAIGSHLPTAASRLRSAIHTECVEHFGWGGGESRTTALQGPLDVFLDFLEIVADAIRGFEAKFNALADRHRFGYRLEAGEIRRIGSPVLADVVVGPALLATQRSGWENVERAYREALSHQRGPSDENDDALTAAGAAMESALKAAGVSGKTLGQLAANFRKSDIAAPQLREVPETLEKLLTRSAAVRNIHGDAHGRAPGDQAQVPQELVDLAVHLVGAFVVYLDAVTRR